MKPGIYTGDARELVKEIPDGSVDLIFTDPPYPGEYLPLYAWMAEHAARILKPTGFLLAYTAPYYKNVIMGYFEAGPLLYFWDYIEYNGGNSTIIWPRRTISRYKSILAYRKTKDAMPRTNVLGVMPGNGSKFGDKRYHKWGQVINTARYYIDVFTQPGDLVVDFFAGAGTTNAACKILGRGCIGFEIDEDTAVVARKRLDETFLELLPNEKQAAML